MTHFSLDKHNMDDDVITEKLRGHEVNFKTRPGVFSRGGLDGGTKLMVDNMEIGDETLIADLGCGTGIIGFVAAKMNPNGHVHLLDVNLRTVELAKENVELNRLWNVEVILSDNFSAVESRTYHQIFSNPAQHLGNEFLKETAQDCFEHLKPHGRVSWVVQSHVKPLIERLFKNIFGNVKIVAHGKDHVVLTAQKKVNYDN